MPVFLSELLGLYILVLGGLFSTYLAIGKLNKFKYTYAFFYSFFTLISFLIAWIILNSFNNFSLLKMPIINPINFIITFINYIKVEQNFMILKSLLFIITSHVLAFICAALTYKLIIKYFKIKDSEKVHSKTKFNKKEFYLLVLYTMILVVFICIIQYLFVTKFNLIKPVISGIIISIFTLVILIISTNHSYFSTNIFMVSTSYFYSILNKTIKNRNYYKYALNILFHILISIIVSLIFAYIF